MALKVEEKDDASLQTSKPVTNVSKKRKNPTKGESEFNTAVCIVAGAWLVLGLLIWSLRKYNI